jgi:hypothetical protein
VIAGLRSSALHLLLYFGQAIAQRPVISLCIASVNLNTSYRMQASVQGLRWFALGCLKADPLGGQLSKVRSKLQLVMEPAQLADQLDRLADELDQPSAPPRNRW